MPVGCCAAASRIFTNRGMQPLLAARAILAARPSATVDVLLCFGEAVLRPLARTIAEQQAIVKAVQASKRIWQTGSWQRSERNFHYAAEIVRNGLLGKSKRVEVGLPSGYSDFSGFGKPLLQKLRQLPEVRTRPAARRRGGDAFAVVCCHNFA